MADMAWCKTYGDFEGIIGHKFQDASCTVESRHLMELLSLHKALFVGL
jgi:hypothetical protein